MLQFKIDGLGYQQIVAETFWNIITIEMIAAEDSGKGEPHL